MFKKYFVALLFIVALTSLIIFFLLNFKDNNKVVFMDVSQGDAIYIRDNGFDILIDGGDGDLVIERLGEFLPFYDQVIELVVLTHPHLDHLGGLIKVLERYEVKTVLETGVICESEACKVWDQVIKEKGINRKIAVKGQKYILENSSLEILFPFQSILDKEYENKNNSSIVSCLTFKDQTFLLTGDAESEVEEVLIKKRENFSACQDVDVLKLGHHGSKSSSIESFLDFVTPEEAIVSAGEDNQFNHPHFVTLEKLKNRQIKVFETSINGSIIYTFLKNGEMEVSTTK